jgi:hypothetical protein
MANGPHLVSVKIKEEFTGDYKCSFCDTVFHPHAVGLGVMAREFAIHVGEAHSKDAAELTP